MPLLDLKTNLKSLKFGFDLPAGGSSKQPFVEKPIPSDDEPTPGASPDYLLRQGTLQRIADDETRFFKYFTSTQGLAFIAKQNILSLTSVQTEASRRFSPNQGTYLPTNTLAQLAANPFGGHLNFLGADPTGLIPGISIKKYGDLVNPPLGIGSIAEPDNNRLVSLSKDLGLIGEKPDETPPQTGLGGALQSARNFLSKGKTVLYSYKGGPGAAEGIGKTNIYRYSNTGFDNPLYTNNPNYFLGKEFTSPVAQLNFGTGNAPKLHDAVGLIDRRYNTYKDDDGNPQQVLKTLGGVSTRYYYLTNSDNGTVGSLRGIGDYDFLINGAGNSPSLKLNTSVYKDKKTLEKREDLNTYLVGKQYSGLEELKENRFDSSSLKVTNGVSDTYNQLTNFSLSQATDDYYGVIEGNSSPTLRNSTSVYKSGSLETDTDVVRRDNPSVRVWNQEFFQDSDIDTDSAKGTGEIKEDFRSVLRRKLRYNLPGQLAYSGAGSGKILDTRVNQGNPGSPLSPFKDVSFYANGSGTGPIDRINALPIYKSTNVAQEIEDGKAVNDLIKFRIASVNNDKPSEFEYMHFRAFIDSFSDSYGTQWAGERYPGRGEEFFRYGGFTRGISLSFTVAAQSKEELMPMYKKLNFLASNTMNDYSDSGYMRAPFIKLTIGGYLYEQFGFLKGIQYGWEMAAPFEIGINDAGGEDPNVKELPHVIRVTGFDFQPIYDFLPQKQRNGFSDSGELTTYGPEKYIALANDIGKGSNNYDTDADGLTNSNPNTVGVGSSQLD